MVGPQFQPPNLTLARVQLRRFEQGDAGALHGLLSDEAVVKAFHHDAAPSLDQVKQRLPTMVAGEVDGKLHRLYIAVTDQQTAELLGMVGLDWAEDIADLRIAIRAESRGHGFGREALAGVLAWVRDTTHLNRVMGVTDMDNADSAEMMLAVGMVEVFEPAGDLHGSEVAARTFAWER